MGEVWRAVDTRLDRPVAVKTLRADRAHDPMSRSLFAAEARHAGGLSHPGIASVYDYGESPGGHAWLVMELVDGAPLSDRLAAGPLPLAEALDVLDQAAQALQAAHDAGVVHRDVKPGNLLVGPDGHVTVTDFGVAAALAPELPGVTDGSVVGTAYYLSPEQATGSPAGTASDVYSLGVVAFECLTGRRPFPGTDPVAVAHAHRSAAPPDLPDDVPPGVRDLVLGALAKDPAARPVRVGDWGRALRGPTTPPVATPRHHRVRSAAAVLVAVVLLAVGVRAFVGPVGEGARVPVLAGAAWEGARTTLTGEGLEPVRREVEAAGVPAGQVVGSDPAAGEVVERGDTVVVLVSRGPAAGPTGSSVGGMPSSPAPTPEPAP